MACNCNCSPFDTTQAHDVYAMYNKIKNDTTELLALGYTNAEITLMLTVIPSSLFKESYSSAVGTVSI